MTAGKITVEASLRTRLRWAEEKVRHLEQENRELRGKLPGQAERDAAFMGLMQGSRAAATAPGAPQQEASGDAVRAHLQWCQTCSDSDALCPEAERIASRAAATAPGAPQQEASGANWNEERQTDQSVTPEFTAWLARPGQHCQGVGANEAWNAGVAWASRAAATAPAGGVTAELAKHLRDAHAFIENTDAFGHSASHGILDCGGCIWNVDESKAALARHDALTTAARAAEPAFYINKSIIDPATGKMAAHVKTAITWSDKPINAAWSTPVYLGAARAAEPAYHCIGFIEQYGRMIGDTQQGKQTIPVYVRAASSTPPTGTSQGEGTS